MADAGAEDRVDVVRRGGIAGVAAHASVDPGRLAPELAASLDAVLAGRVEATPARGRADMFTYEFSSGDGARRRTARVAEHDLPPELAPLLAELSTQWRLR